ncbi:hypothetical protein BGZ98_009836 [Dissophora globulifera]|nr:hypothetical protein BGZ98_009836 [Dissophora globulifera]
MGLFRRSRPAQDALEFANVNLKFARNAQDGKQILKYCKAAKKELEKIKVSESLIYLDQIIAAYREHGGVLEKLGFSSDAAISYNMANNLESNIPNAAVSPKASIVAQQLPPIMDVRIRTQTSVPPVALTADQVPHSSQSTDAPGHSSPLHSPALSSTNQLASLSPTLSSAGHTISGHNLELVPASIFARDIHPQLYTGPMPKPDEDLTDTRQLAYCLALLQASPVPYDSLDETRRIWLRNAKADEDEQERLRTMATDLLVEFIRDGLKDEKTTSEIACIALVLESGNFRSLLGIFVDNLKDSALLPIHALEGLDSVIQCAAPGSMDPDDLIKILEYVKLSLQDTNTQSLDHVYRLTRTVSHILDAMVDDEIKDLDRVKLHTPLLLYSKELQRHTDPYMVFQAAYTLQALLRVPDDEKPWQTVLRHTGTMVKGASRLVTAAKGFNVGEFIDAIQGGLEVAGQLIGVVGDTYEDFSALKESGQDLLEALKTSFNQKRVWYPMLRGIDVALRNGELTKVKAMISDAPCRRELAFQWGVCLRLATLAADPIWDADSQEEAVAFLGEIYRNDAVWGQEVKVKQCILNILIQLTSASGSAKQAADRLLLELADDNDPRKRALYDASQKEGSSSNLWKVTLPLPTSSPLLDRVQKTPAVEADLRKLARVRLQDVGDTIYVAPEAKSHRQAADHALFDLTAKAKEFLDSNKKVLLIWGDSGAGKSTFNRELERELWNDYINCKDRILKKQKKIPVFVTLPAVDKLEPDLIGRQLHKARFNEAQIQGLKDKRNFVLICDGYDEYQQMRNLYDINELNRPGQWKAQMVITCRSEYLGLDYRHLFQPEDRHGQMGEALLQEAVIAPFSKDQIQAYIEKYVAKEALKWTDDKEVPHWEAKDYLRVFDKTPSLQELITNPFLLTLSLRVLPGMADIGKNISSIKVTRVMLYDRFVEQWVEQGKRRLIKRELVGSEKKAFDILSADSFSRNAILFVKKLAVAIFENQDGIPVVEYSFNREEDPWKVEFFGQDDSKKLLREVCPLHRYDNQYRFIHKSLLEYCFARAVFEPQHGEENGIGKNGQESPPPTSNGSQHHGREKEMSVADSLLSGKSFVDRPAVLQFLAERASQEPAFKQQLRDFIEYSKTDKKWCIAAANAITILIRAGVRFNGEDLRGIQIPGADLSGGEFDSTQLQGADLRDANFRNIWLRQANLSEAQMSGAQFGEWPYLKEDSTVLSCAYSPDGNTCALGLGNGTISVFDTSTWVKIHTLQGHTEAITSVVYSPKGHQIASGSEDKTVRLWDAHTGAPGTILSGHTSQVRSVAYSPNGRQIASGSEDETVRLWNAQTGAPGLILRGHAGCVRSVTYSPNGHQIASASHDKTIRLWAAQTGMPGLVLSGHTDFVASVAYSPSGHQIASGGSDNTVRLWDVQTGAPGPVLSGHTGRVLSVVYSPNGHQIASASRDRTARLWDAQTGAPGPIFRGHTGWVHGVSFSPSGHQIASGSEDETVRLWNAHIGALGPILSGHTHWVQTVAYSPSGHQIASGSMDNKVRLWDARTGVPGPILSGHTHWVQSVAYSPSGDQIASGSRDYSVRLWDAQTGAPGPILSGHTNWVLSVLYTPSGHQIASASSDHTVRLWDTQTGEPGAILSGHTDWVWSMAFSPSGHQIVTGSEDTTVRLWDAQDGAPGSILRGHTSSVTDVAYSPSGHQIASGSVDNTLRLWDAQTGVPGLILSGHTRSVQNVAYSPGGYQIASGSEDHTVRLWDVDSGQCLVVVKDFYAPIESIAWRATLDGIYFVTGSGSIRVWEVIEGEDDYQMRLHWRSMHGGLAVSDMCIQNAQGLSSINLQLLGQRGAVGGLIPPSSSYEAN